jgi:hypothetical protein
MDYCRQVIADKSSCKKSGFQMIYPDRIGTKKHTLTPIGLDMSIQIERGLINITQRSRLTKHAKHPIFSDESIGCLPQNCPNHTPETCGYKLAQNETDKKRARLSIQFESAESKDD